MNLRVPDKFSESKKIKHVKDIKHKHVIRIKGIPYIWSLKENIVFGIGRYKHIYMLREVKANKYKWINISIRTDKSNYKHNNKDWYSNPRNACVSDFAKNELIHVYYTKSMKYLIEFMSMVNKPSVKYNFKGK